MAWWTMAEKRRELSSLSTSHHSSRFFPFEQLLYVTLGTRRFSRVWREFSVEGRHIFGHRLYAPVTIKTLQYPETALETFLAHRVTFCSI